MKVFFKLVISPLSRPKLFMISLDLEDEKYKLRVPSVDLESCDEAF
jgi:hypothetical protein